MDALKLLLALSVGLGFSLALLLPLERTFLGGGS